MRIQWLSQVADRLQNFRLLRPHRSASIRALRRQDAHSRNAIERLEVRALLSFTAAAGSPITVGTQPRFVTMGDINLDGKSDLVVANQGSNSVSVLLGSGTGTFSSASGSPITVGNTPTGAAIADFNNDGKPDFVVANLLSNDSVLLGSGTGTFSAAPGSPINTGGASNASDYSVATGDFNNDGKADFVVANFINNTAAGVTLGNGNGTFVTTVDYIVTGSTKNVVVGDINGDGKPDLVLSNRYSNTVSVLLGSGTGTFGTPAYFNVGSGADNRFVAIGDINGDGKPDLAVTNRNLNTVSVLLNTTTTGAGLPTFANAVNSTTGTSPTSVAIGDVDGDGKSDLAVTNLGNNNVSVLLGTGTASFPTRTNFAVGTQPYSVAIGDVNGDGRPDLVTANYGSGNVSVLLNTFPDITPPSTTSFTRKTPATSPTNADTLVFLATFSEAVTGVSAADFAVTGTTATISVSQVTPSTYDVTIGGGNLAALDGTVGLNFNSPSITDLASNALPNTEPSIDQTYVIDNTAPTTTSFTRKTPATSPTNADTLVFLATFSEDVTGVSAADFAVTGTTGTISVAQLTASTYDVTISGGDLEHFRG